MTGETLSELAGDAPIEVTLEMPRKPRSALVNLYSVLMARP